MRRYEAYKNSGVAWLGEIPAGWEVVRLKRLLISPLQYGANATGVEFDEALPRYIRITDITSDNKLKDTGKQSLANNSEQYLLYDNDILFARSGATVGKTFLFKKEYGKAAFAGYLIRARIDAKKANPEFIYWFTLSKYYEIWKDRIFIQSTIQNISAEKYNNLSVPVPPTDEQNTIAKFLDDKVSQIEKLISIRQRQIIDLSDLKKAIINKAVTKGLKSGAKMKDSGFLWLGEIPAGWEVAPIKRLFTLQTGATPDTSKPEFWDGSILWVTPSDFQTEQKYISGGKKTITQAGYNSCGTKLAPKGSVIFSKRAPIGKVAITSEELCTNQGCISCINRGYVSAEYFYYLLSSLPDVFNALGNGATFKEISASDFGNFRVLVPPADEQNEIAAYLDKKCSQINRAITNTQQQISELGELKARLISDAVTGKIDVR